MLYLPEPCRQPRAPVMFVALVLLSAAGLVVSASSLCLRACVLPWLWS